MAFLDFLKYRQTSRQEPSADGSPVASHTAKQMYVHQRALEQMPESSNQSTAKSPANRSARTPQTIPPPSPRTFKRGQFGLVQRAMNSEPVDAQRYIRWFACRQDFASQIARGVVRGKGKIALQFAPSKTAQSRAQSRPKLCLGETYAEAFSSSQGSGVSSRQGCISRLSLLPIPLAGRPSSTH